MPTLLPWPLTPGWTVTDFGTVAAPDREARASFVTVTGASDLDGVVELSVVSEEPGRRPRRPLRRGGPHRPGGRDRGGAAAREGPHRRAPDLPVAGAHQRHDATFDRSVFAGEANGRWLWLVLRPASAALLLKDEWILMNIADLGPELIDLPFGGSPPAWSH